MSLGSLTLTETIELRDLDVATTEKKIAQALLKVLEETTPEQIEVSLPRGTQVAIVTAPKTSATEKGLKPSTV